MKTLLVTGANGFLGSYFVEAALNRGFRVLAFKRSTSDLWRIQHLLNDMHCYDWDTQPLSRPFKEFQIDALLHFATSYGRQGESSSAVVQANLALPLELLEHCSTYDVPCYINTDSYYHKVSHPNNFLIDYSLSKKHFLEWGTHLSKTRDILFANLKLEHLYGPRDSHQKFCTSIVHQLKNNVPTLDLTEGSQLRDFIYIDDAVQAFFHIMQFLEGQSGSFYPFEIGTGIQTSIRSFVEHVHELSRSRTQLNFGALPQRDHEIEASVANLYWLNQTGWQAQTSLTEGIKQMLATAPLEYEVSRR